jgi:hypothetical protein
MTVRCEAFLKVIRQIAGDQRATENFAWRAVTTKKQSRLSDLRRQQFQALILNWVIIHQVRLGFVSQNRFVHCAAKCKIVHNSAQS